MAKVEDIIAEMKRNPKGIRFLDLCKVCDAFFGKARQEGSSHQIYKTPWQGDPRVNIQNVGDYPHLLRSPTSGKKAKPQPRISRIFTDWF